MLQAILLNQKQILAELDRELKSKVDRYEFSNIVQNKANSFELNKLIHEIQKAKSFEHL